MGRCSTRYKRPITVREAASTDRTARDNNAIYGVASPKYSLSLPRNAGSTVPPAGALASKQGACGTCLGVRRQLPMQQERPGRLACSEAARPTVARRPQSERGAREPAGRGTAARAALEEDRRRPFDANLPRGEDRRRPTVPSAQPRITPVVVRGRPAARESSAVYSGGQAGDLGTAGDGVRADPPAVIACDSHAEHLADATQFSKAHAGRQGSWARVSEL